MQQSCVNFVCMNVQGFLFDVDGVLFDSMPQHARSWLAAFREKGVSVSAKDVYLCEGMPEVTAAVYLAGAVKATLSKREFEQVVARKRKLFNGYPKPRLIKGAKQLFIYLKKFGFKVCLVTGSHQFKTIRLIKENFGITRKGIVTGKDIARGKPHPEPYLAGLRKVQLSPRQVLVVENAPLGIQSAKSAAIKCVALRTGLLSTSDLKKHGADWVFRDCGELLVHLSKGLL